MRLVVLDASRGLFGAARDLVEDRLGALSGEHGQSAVDPATLTAAERLQYEGWRRRAEDEVAVLALHREGVAIKEIARRTNRSRKLVRDVVRGGRSELFRPRASSLEPWLDRLSAEWAGGCRNGAELWRRLTAFGFGGSLRVVTEWATRRRQSWAGTRRRRRRADAPRRGLWRE